VEIENLRGQIDSTSAAIAALGTPTTEQGATRLAQLERDLAQYQQANASLVQTLEALRITEAQSTSNVVQVEPAAVPEKPVRPRTLVNTLLAAVVGGMLAVGVVFLIEYLDDSLKSADDVQRALDLPVLGAIAHVQRGNSVGTYALEHPRSPVAEAFRSLRTNIQFASVDRPLRTLAISSPAPEEGKSTVATNLAAALAQGGKQVILVDADLRRPRLHTLLGLPNRLGLSDLFVRTDLALPDVLQPGALPNLRVLTSGNLPPNPAELLGSERMARLLAELTELADIVVLDSPPALLVTDAALLGARADGLLLVAEAGRTRRDVARAAVESLRRTGTKVLGVVLNNVPMRRGHYYSDYRYAYAYYDNPDAQPAVDAK
jgi:non-specific protein-tyrosine kinase